MNNLDFVDEMFWSRKEVQTIIETTEHGNIWITVRSTTKALKFIGQISLSDLNYYRSHFAPNEFPREPCDNYTIYYKHHNKKISFKIQDLNNFKAHEVRFYNLKPDSNDYYCYRVDNVQSSDYQDSLFYEDEFLVKSIDYYRGIMVEITFYSKEKQFGKFQTWGTIHHESAPAHYSFDRTSGNIRSMEYLIQGVTHHNYLPAKVIFNHENGKRKKEMYYHHGVLIGENLSIYTEEDMQNYLILR